MNVRLTEASNKDRNHPRIVIVGEQLRIVGEYERTDRPLIGIWDCDLEAAITELYQTFRNPYPDDPWPDIYNNR